MKIRQPTAIELSGPWLDVTASELCEFVDEINRDQPAGSMVSVSLNGLTNVLESPERLIDLLMLAVGNRCQNDDQLLTLAAVIFREFETRFQIEISSEQLARAAEMLKSATQAITQQPEDQQ